MRDLLKTTYQRQKNHQKLMKTKYSVVEVVRYQTKQLNTFNYASLQSQRNLTK